MVTKNYRITDKGKQNGLTIEQIHRDIDHIVCATQYDIYGQSSLYGNYHFKDNCLLGVSISADTESEIDNYVDTWVNRLHYLEEIKEA